ncbi:MAG: hypothetical protein ACK4KT_02360 [Thermaurantimonas sp.]
MMRSASLVLGVYLMCVWNLLGQQFEERVTTASNIRLTVTNAGTFGNAFRGYRDGTGRQSCEYPAGSGIEHLFEGGLWVGGIRRGDGSVLVSTSALDAPQGYAPGRSGFEFTIPIGAPGFQERSSLTDSRFFTPSAVSHQDFVAVFSDESQTIPGTTIPISGHQFPMNIQVTQETYNWNFSFSDFFVVVNYRLKNVGNASFDSLYVALWNNTVVRNIRVTPAGAGGSVFYSQGGNGYMDSLGLAYCYDATGDVGFTESYIGQKFLGAVDKFGFHHFLLDSTFNQKTGQWIKENFKAHYNAWQFNNANNPIFFFPNNDELRYNKMTTGLNHHPCWLDPASPACQSTLGVDLQTELNKSGNRSDLVSVGPFNDFLPGDEIEVTFAYVIARKFEDGNPNSVNSELQRSNLITNSNWVQVAYNGEDKNFNGVLDPGEDTDGNGRITRFILPAPPDIPRTRIEPADGKLEIYWSDNSLYSIDPILQEMDFEGFRVYLTKPGFDVADIQNVSEAFVLIAEFDEINGIGNDVGLEKIRLPSPVKFEGDTIEYHFKYTADNLLNGWQYAVSVTAFDRGDVSLNLDKLESSILANQYRAFPGTRENDDMIENEPFVYPNPYYYGSSWEGISNFQEETRKIYFANLPKRCKISIYNPVGELIDEIMHDENYNGTDIRWFRTFASENPDRNRFSGGEHAWDLLSKNTQIISRGLYLYAIIDLDTRKRYTGNFVIIK